MKGKASFLAHLTWPITEITSAHESTRFPGLGPRDFLWSDTLPVCICITERDSQRDYSWVCKALLYPYILTSKKRNIWPGKCFLTVDFVCMGGEFRALLLQANEWSLDVCVWERGDSNLSLSHSHTELFWGKWRLFLPVTQSSHISSNVWHTTFVYFLWGFATEDRRKTHHTCPKEKWSVISIMKFQTDISVLTAVCSKCANRVEWDGWVSGEWRK